MVVWFGVVWCGGVMWFSVVVWCGGVMWFGVVVWCGGDDVVVMMWWFGVVW